MNNLEQEENNQKLVNLSSLLAKSLLLILKEGEGISVTSSHTHESENDYKKFIVFRSEQQIHIVDDEYNLEEGTIVNINNTK